MKASSVVIAAFLILAMLQIPSMAASPKAYYEEHCVACHGETGLGDGPAAAVLDVPAGDLTDCGTMKSLSDDYLRKIITGGGEAVGKSPQMPGSAGLAEEELAALVVYVRSLCQE